MNAHDTMLPALGDDRIDEMEAALFRRIAAERGDELADARRARTRAVRRGRIWMGAAAAASVVAVAALIAPQLGLGTGVTGAGSSAPSVSVAEDARTFDTGTAASGGGAVADSVTTPADRVVIASATATVRVNDARAAIDAISTAATGAGGYTESMSITGTDAPAPGPIPQGDAMAFPTPGAVIAVRVPADALTSTLQDLARVGEVTSSQISRSDVTTQSVDLRARASSLEASVARLTELMAQSTSTADLIAAESALAQRQSELDSLRQQLTWLDDQVRMSSLVVTLVDTEPAPAADPAGFGDGLVAGWHGLIATLNGVVVGVGFLLPWLGVAAVAAVVVWAVRAAVRRRRQRPSQPPSTGSTTPET